MGRRITPFVAVLCRFVAQGFLQSGPCPNPSDRFHVGRVAVYRRGETWYLDYHEHGQRRRPRAGRNRASARRQVAQINAQLENFAPTALNFEPVALDILRAHWLDYLEHVRRASLATLRRYRAASDHLLRYCDAERGGGVRGGLLASQLAARDAEAFAARASSWRT